jgi:hypothetical protein
VLLTTHVNGRFREPAIVSFSDGRPNVRFSYPGPDDFLPLEERDWQEISTLLDAFYRTAVDVTRGPERFDPYLPQDMRRMLDLRGEKNRMFLTPDAVRTLSNDQLRRFAALTFDHMVLRLSLELHDVQAPDTLFRPADIRRDAVAAIARLEQSAVEMRRLLAAAGVDAARMAASALYMRRMLGEGYMVREDPARDGISGLPRGARMFTVMLGGPLPHVIAQDGRLRIVAVDFF